MTNSLIAIGASTLAGLATALGAAAVFFFRTVSARVEDAMLSLAAGIMLSATFFSLIVPGIAYAEALGHARPLAVLEVSGGILLGALLVFVLNKTAPHEHFVLGREGPVNTRLSRVWLFVITITLHNLPEGMAVGIGFAGQDAQNGLALAIGIGIQNIPEGLAVAGALYTVGYSRFRAFLIASLTGCIEGVGGVLAVLLTVLVGTLLPWILGLAAGAMLYIISDEIIPETHGRGHRSLATFSLIGGFLIMMMLDATLG